MIEEYYKYKYSISLKVRLRFRSFLISHKSYKFTEKDFSMSCQINI